jgi:tetratricopeptide (TPR) repeat protein
MDHAEFPASETLAAFIDGQLDDATRTEVVAHIAHCEECYATLAAAREWKKNEGSPAVVTHASFGRKRWVAALATAAAIGAVVLVTPEVRDRLAMRELVAAANARPQRPAAELPLSGFEFRPAAPVQRGDGDKSESHDARLDSAAADVAERAESRPTPRNLHAEGVAYLLAGHADDAVRTLSRAMGGGDARAIAATSDVALLTDFGAAAYAKHDYALALEAYSRAAALAPKDAAARFGLGRTLQAMGRRDEAKREYLAIDPTSPWANEARSSLRAME